MAETYYDINLVSGDGILLFHTTGMNLANSLIHKGIVALLTHVLTS